jgi:uncharacterized heparinase superfamily protein
VAEGILRRELPRQVRTEGSHLEASLMYHCVALEDVLDLVNLEAASGPGLHACVRQLGPAMLGFARAVETPGGDYPLLGDAGRGAAPAPRALAAYAARLGIAVPEQTAGLRFFEGCRIAVWRQAGQFLLADLGPIGAPHLPGHGHCDSLSFEWHVDGVPILVDSGTRSYESGPARQASRSTRAHNTLEIDAREPHEIWAAFRVGRRSEVRAWREGEGVQGELLPWWARRLRWRRRFEVGPHGVRIQDRVEGPGSHRVTSRLHLHPNCTLSREGRHVDVRHGRARARILLPDAPHFELFLPERSGSWHCERLGEARPNAVLVGSWSGRLPLGTEIVLSAGGAA